MEFSSQLKKLRAETGLSQEELAEKVYVTRQTVSNWENEKSYPDIHSLLLLSSLFHVSLDQLIKGDVIVCAAALYVVTIWCAFKVEKLKKANDIYTYKEIVAFTDGKRLDELTKQQEIGKRPYQQFLLALGSALIVVVIALIVGFLLR